MCWYPQAPLTTLQACRRILVLLIMQYIYISIYICIYNERDKLMYIYIYMYILLPSDCFCRSCVFQVKWANLASRCSRTCRRIKMATRMSQLLV